MLQKWGLQNLIFEEVYFFPQKKNAFLIEVGVWVVVVARALLRGLQSKKINWSRADY